MAMRTFYATKDMKHPTYRTRMLRAGDQLELDGPSARLFTRLGAITDQAPKPKAEDLSSKTKAELAKIAGLDDAAAKKLTKTQLIEKINGA